MKKKSIFAFLCICLLASCNDDDSDSNCTVVTFEQAALNGNGHAEQTAYTESQTTFSNAYDETSGYWCGFAISNCTDTQTSGFLNQFSVYGNGGANASDKFAVGYCGDYLERNPSIEFLDPRTVESILLNNSTYTYLSIVNGSDYNRAFTTGDYLLLTVTGYDAQDTPRGTVDFYLADYRRTNALPVSTWTKVSLETLGAVKKLVFTMTTTDMGPYGANTPLYFCIDDISFR